MRAHILAVVALALIATAQGEAGALDELEPFALTTLNTSATLLHLHANTLAELHANLLYACGAAKSVCACSSIAGCGWCNATRRCAAEPECTTTCDECASDCDQPVCTSRCAKRFRKPTHKPYVIPLDAGSIVCTVAVFCAVVMASAAGIGGGAVLVPIFTLLGGFTEHEAIPLSIATIFGGCALRRRSPARPRVLPV